MNKFELMQEIEKLNYKELSDLYYWIMNHYNKVLNQRVEKSMERINEII